MPDVRVHDPRIRYTLLSVWREDTLRTWYHNAMREVREEERQTTKKQRRLRKR